jgi:hypothetical protein
MDGLEGNIVIRRPELNRIFVTAISGLRIRLCSNKALLMLVNPCGGKAFYRLIYS